MNTPIFEHLNWLHVLIAAIGYFAVGSLWYSPVLFAKAWMRESGVTDEKIKTGSMAKIFGFAFLWTFVMAFNLAMYLNAPGTNLAWGATAGFLAGFGWVAMSIFITGLFERKSITYMLINAGYMVVALTAMGAIIGAWR